MKVDGGFKKKKKDGEKKCLTSVIISLICSSKKTAHVISINIWHVKLLWGNVWTTCKAWLCFLLVKFTEHCDHYEVDCTPTSEMAMNVQPITCTAMWTASITVTIAVSLLHVHTELVLLVAAHVSVAHEEDDIVVVAMDGRHEIEFYFSLLLQC